MAYVIISNDTVSNNVPTPYGISLNFSMPGVFETLTSSDRQGLANLKNLILTYPGERFENPAFGCNLKQMLFEQNTDIIAERIKNTLTSAISNFTPYINIISIDTITAEDDPTFEHYVRVTLTFSVNRSALEQTITITATDTGLITVS